MKALLDRNILIDYLNGIKAARSEIDRYAPALISSITWMEVMVGAVPEEETIVRGFLKRFSVVPIDDEICETAVRIRRSRRIKLPDAIVWASAQINDALLVSRNSHDFPVDHPSVRIPYQV